MTEQGTSVAPGSAFIGRERELAELVAGLPAARGGRGSLFLIRGDAGIGKTRLAEELTRRAAEQGTAVVWGRCIEGAGAPAFWPWLQLLRTISSHASLRTTLSEQQRAESERLIQALHQGSAATAGESSAATWAQAETERFQLFDAITMFLRGIGEHAACGFVLDDLHVADLPSLLLLAFVARQSTLPFWMVGTYREVEADNDPQRRDVIAAIARVGRSFSLAGLSQPEVGRLIEQAVGTVAAPAMVRRICDLTDGNPFFVDELARLLWSQLEQPAQEIPARISVPSGVRDVLRQRMRPLSAECLHMLRAAAVVGRELSFALLRALVAIEPARLLDLIDEAQALRILESRSGRRLAFAHALIRETLYDDLSASARVALHRQVGEAIERLHAESLEEHLPALAYHYARAAPAGDAERALEYAERAARRATTALAYEDAAQLYEIALEALSLLTGDMRERAIDLHLALGDLHIRAGDAPRARAVFERAAEAARNRADAVRFARAALGCGGVGLGIPQGTVDRPLVTLIEEALAQPASHDAPALRMRLLARLALELYFSDAVGQRRALMDEAVSLAHQADRSTQAYVAHARLVGLWDITPPAERLRWSEELISRAQDIGDDDLVLRGRSYKLLEIIDTAIADAWEAEVDTITALAERMRQPRYIGMAVGTRSMHSVWVGRFAEADALGVQALELAQAVRDPSTSISIAVQSFFMLRLRGEADEVEASARFIHAGAPTIPGARCMLVLALCGLNRLDEARSEIEHLGDHDFDVLRRANRIASLVPWLAEAAALLGDRARMQSLYRDLEPLAQRNITLQTRVCFGPAAYYLGMIAAGLGRHDEAVGHFTTAAALASRMRGRPLVALIQLEHARSLTALGADSDARALFDQARLTTTALGMHAITKRIDRLLGGERSGIAAAVSPHPPRAAEPHTSGRARASLRREGSLWTIAANGTVLRCKGSKGLAYLAHLLRYPSTSFHVAELLALDDPDPGPRRTPDVSELGRLGMHIGPPQVGEPLADAKALAAYRARLQDLSVELADAERCNDLARSTRIQEELDTLSHALLQAAGFGGRARVVGSFSERARLNVTRAIRSAIRRIGEGHPDLEGHLTASVKTGTFCSYAPERGDTVEWDV